MLSAPLRRSSRPPRTQGHPPRLFSFSHSAAFGPLGLHLHSSPHSCLSALDDCIALQHVMRFLCARLGIGLIELHRRFAVRFDEQASVAQVHALLA